MRELTRKLGQLMPIVTEAMMQLREDWRSHSLTLVGIVWGTAAVVLLLSLGTGVTSFLDLGVDKTGDRWVLIIGGYTTAESGGQRPGRQIYFHDEDVSLLRAGAPSASAISPVNIYFMSAETPRQTRSTVVSAGEPDLQRIQNHTVSTGRYLDETDIAEGRQVAVLGAELVEIFFGAEDPIGQHLQLNGVPFRVVGTLAEKGFQFMTNNDLHDRMIFVPLEAGRRVEDQRDVVQVIYMNPWRMDEVHDLQAEIKSILWPLHEIQDGDDEAIQLMNVPDVMSPIRNIFVALKIVLGSVGAVTLAMSGVGVANLMLAIVNERRREFAMRRACGARRSDVTFQLLAETAVIVIAGGLLGVIVALLLMGLLLVLPLPEQIPRPVPSASVLLTAFSVLVGTGIASGILPARVASQVDPATALRVN